MHNELFSVLFTSKFNANSFTLTDHGQKLSKCLNTATDFVPLSHPTTDQSTYQHTLSLNLPTKKHVVKYD